MKKTRLEKVKKRAKIKQGNLNSEYLCFLIGVNKNYPGKVKKTSLSTLSLFYQNNRLFERCSGLSLSHNGIYGCVASFPQVSGMNLYLPTSHVNIVELMSSQGTELEGNQYLNNFYRYVREDKNLLPDERVRNCYVPAFASYLSKACRSVVPSTLYVNPTISMKNSVFFKEAKKQNCPIILFSMNLPFLLSKSFALSKVEKEYKLPKDLFYHLFENHNRIFLCYTINNNSRKTNKSVLVKKALI